MIAIFPVVMFLLAVSVAIAATVQHVVSCWVASAWTLMIAGEVFLPIAVMHGWGIWLGFWQ